VNMSKGEEEGGRINGGGGGYDGAGRVAGERPAGYRKKKEKMSRGLHGGATPPRPIFARLLEKKREKP